MNDIAFPNTSPPEAVRVALALVGFVAAFWGLAHTTDGMAAFASPIRGRMVRRRRWQMACALGMFSALGIQAMIVSTTPDVYPLSFQTFSGNLALIVVSGLLLFVTLHQALGWTAFEEVLGKTPLVPVGSALVEQTSLAGRRVLHDLNGDLALAVGEVEILLADPSLAVAHRAALVRVSDYAAAMAHRIVDVQQLVRSLSPEVPPASVGEHAPS